MLKKVFFNLEKKSDLCLSELNISFYSISTVNKQDKRIGPHSHISSCDLSTNLSFVTSSHKFIQFIL